MKKSKKNGFVVCIPARYASSRLPGKPLIKLCGKELILWAIESALKLGADQVVVATDDKRIFDFVQSNGCEVVMTRSDHETGTDRLAECADIMKWADDTLVLNYQGDEPNIPAANVMNVLNAMNNDPSAAVGTLYQEISDINTLFDENTVKVVTDHQNRALYFSRAAIPWFQKEFSKAKPQMPVNTTYKHHIGLYAYKVSFLKKISSKTPCEIEKAESLEQLRALFTGEIIVVAKATEKMPHGIDTKNDVDAFERRMKK